METHTHNWLERTELLLGSEKLELLRNAHVLVVGLGGVGAYAAEMRSGGGMEADRPLQQIYRRDYALGLRQGSG